MAILRSWRIDINKLFQEEILCWSIVWKDLLFSQRWNHGSSLTILTEIIKLATWGCIQIFLHSTTYCTVPKFSDEAVPGAVNIFNTNGASNAADVAATAPQEETAPAETSEW